MRIEGETLHYYLEHRLCRQERYTAQTDTASFLVRRRDIEQTELISNSVFEFDISTLLKK